MGKRRGWEKFVPGKNNARGSSGRQFLISLGGGTIVKVEAQGGGGWEGVAALWGGAGV